MRHLLAIIYLVIFFFSAVVHEKKSIVVKDYKQSKVLATLDSANQCDPSENHGNSDTHCLNCHFGHYSMIIGSFVQVIQPHDEIIYPYGFSSVYSYNHQFGIFRPPIS